MCKFFFDSAPNEETAASENIGGKKQPDILKWGRASFGVALV